MTRGFTLLEICLAIFLAMLVIGMAVPTLNSILASRNEAASFEAFNALVDTARTSAIQEQRPWVLEWHEGNILLRPQDTPAARETFTPGEKESLSITLPAALVANPPPLWTFWPAGICEPATIVFKSPKSNWTARYEAFKERPEVVYE